MTKVVIVGAVRTPIGTFQGALASLTAPALAATCAREALRRADLGNEDVQEVHIGNVLSAGVGQAPARQMALLAGLSERVPTVTVNKVCGSGLQAVIHGARSVLCGDHKLVLSGGMESMSNAPHLLMRSRTGVRLGNAELSDAVLRDGLVCASTGDHMGVLAERMAARLSISREAQDAFAAESYSRARTAWDRGLFSAETVGVEVNGPKPATTWVRQDEQPFAADMAKLPSLRPAFAADGTITAGNASSLNDGAAVVLLASETEARRRHLPSLATIVGYASAAQAPAEFGSAPVQAIHKLLRKADLRINDIDLFEINQAFAAVSLAIAHELGLPPERVDVNGGAVALGHPIGASGARLLVSLVHALEQRGARRGVVSLCIGGGEAVAMLVERTS